MKSYGLPTDGTPQDGSMTGVCKSCYNRTEFVSSLRCANRQGMRLVGTEVVSGHKWPNVASAGLIAGFAAEEMAVVRSIRWVYSLGLLREGAVQQA